MYQFFPLLPDMSNYDSILHAYAVDCLGLKCSICHGEAKDPLLLQKQLLEDGYFVYQDSEGAKWL